MKLKWTYENCYNEAKKYDTRTEFRISSGGCYAAALKNNWLDDYYWMPKRKKVISKWTKQICDRIAHKYKTKSEFELNDKGCYLAAMRAGWLKEMDWFEPAVIEPMEKFEKTHCVYVYKDEELNVAYVGLTSNLRNRHNRHQKSGSVFKYFSSIDKEIPQPIILKDNLTPEESRYYEDYYLQCFKEEGYNTLNKGCTGKYCGSFGGGRVIYTKEKCYEIAKQYEYLGDFIKENESCYNRARLKGYLKEYTWLKHKHNQWPYEVCEELSKKYDTLKDFKKFESKCYAACYKMGFLNNFSWLKKDEQKIWTKEKVFEKSKEYQTVGEFKKMACGAYSAASKNRWLSEITWLKRRNK